MTTKTAEDIVRALANRNPVGMDGQGSWRCELCGNSNDHAAERVTHDADCPYHIAETWVAAHPAVRTDGAYAYADGGIGFDRLPDSLGLPIDESNEVIQGFSALMAHQLHADSICLRCQVKYVAKDLTEKPGESVDGSLKARDFYHGCGQRVFRVWNRLEDGSDNPEWANASVEQILTNRIQWSKDSVRFLSGACDANNLGAGISWPTRTLLDICREFDAIDLSECNRRLEAGEPFDAACDEAMEKRQALGDQIKERLGAEWGDFERRHEDFLREFPDQESRSACAVVALMIDAAAYSLHSSVVEPVNLTDDAWALMRRYAQRIEVLLS